MAFSGSDFIFSDERRYRIARHLAFWVAWALFFAIIYGTRPHGFNGKWFYFLTSYSLSFMEAVIYMPDHMLFSYIIIYFLIPRYLFSGKYAQLLIGILLTILLVQFTCHWLTVNLVVYIRHSLGLPAPLNSFYYSLMAGLRGGITVGGFAAAIKLAKYWYLKQQDNQLLVQKNLEAELQMLKAQVHPHFLFNTLNNLYALTLTQSPKSPEIVLKLSALLNHMLYECNTPKVPLEKEVDLLRNYVALEKIRYESRLDVSVNVTGDIPEKLIAPLLLLPFVENSFKHGTSEQLDQAWISLDLHVKNDTLKFKLINGKNAGPLLTVHKPGIGLQNVQKRLELIYPNRHELLIMDEEETFVVILTLQLESTAPAVLSQSTLHIPASSTVTLDMP